MVLSAVASVCIQMNALGCVQMNAYGCTATASQKRWLWALYNVIAPGRDTQLPSRPLLPSS